MRRVSQSGSCGIASRAAAAPYRWRRYTSVRIRVGGMKVGTSTDLQPYLWKVLQEQDAATEISLTIEATSSNGLSAEILANRIVVAFDQLGVTVTWEPG